MIFEIASITVREGLQAEFEAGVEQAVSLFRRARGCREMRLEHSIETSVHYRLIVGWDTVDDHMVGFRNSSDFGIWRSLVGHTFAEPPTVEHTTIAISGFDLRRGG